MNQIDNIISYALSGNDVLQHFLAAFEASGSPVPSNLLDILGTGKFFALAPMGLTRERILQLKTGGLVPTTRQIQIGKYLLEKKGSLAESLVEIIHANFGRRGFFVFIREPYLKIGDNSEILAELSNVGSELYKIIGVASVDWTALSSDIRKFTVPWSFLLIVTQQSQCKNLGELIASAVLIAVNAYDDESYVYWCRNGLE